MWVFISLVTVLILVIGWFSWKFYVEDQEKARQYRQERDDWIRLYGSDDLKRHINHNIDRWYRQERLALERPGWTQNGTLMHCNPVIWSEGEIPPFTPSGQIYQQDIRWIELAKDSFNPTDDPKLLYRRSSDKDAYWIATLHRNEWICRLLGVENVQNV